MSTMTIKHGSAETFFKDLATKNVHFNHGADRTNGVNIYAFMQDEIIIPRTKIPEDILEIIFYFKDFTQESRKELTNIYTYKVQVYDDLSYVLKLVDFGIIGSAVV